MELIIKPMAAGKTYELVQWTLDKPHRAILVWNSAEKERVLHHFPSLTKEQIYTWAEYEQHYLAGKDIEEVVIDNADIFIRRHFGQHRIAMCSFTGGVLLTRRTGETIVSQ